MTNVIKKTIYDKQISFQNAIRFGKEKIHMNQKVTILSKPPFPIVATRNPYYRFRYYLDYILHLAKKNTYPIGVNGPNSVIINLSKGLMLNKFEFNVNPTVFSTNSHVGVLSDVNALNWAIRAKELNKIKKLVAGPNLVVLPSENDAIICSDQIDIVITPCKWVSELYISNAPQLKQKIREWPVGVDTNLWSPINGVTRNKWILYDKSNDGGKEIVDLIESELISRGYNYQKIVYGNYSPQNYLSLLRSAVAMIVVSTSESQGLAQLEAWSCNVPILVWDRGFWKSRDGSMEWIGASSSPYLSESCGDRFVGENDFVQKLDEFISQINSYKPRDFILTNFTLEIGAQKYIELFFD
ncbi:MAG: hypothetical protein C0412_11625 [Flavobacterium sp.]|nr:hypothetical protein [Flavobacterium sp.]